jgi:hypothetical protein
MHVVMSCGSHFGPTLKCSILAGIDPNNQQIVYFNFFFEPHKHKRPLFASSSLKIHDHDRKSIKDVTIACMATNGKESTGTRRVDCGMVP